ncbi:MAG TPA: DNA polymerase IV [Holophagaceae bacterium]|nr:DNA polymerase IV [Holophagaceae bacterium]
MSEGWEGRRIAHLDMDAFFASVELLTRPELRGQPVVVGGRSIPASGAVPRLKDYRGRGVVTTATYEARAYGVRSGMGLMKAAALAPEALLLPANFEAYARMSRAFKAAAAVIAPCMEDRGIDEIYLDLTEVEGGTRELGLRLKAAVLEATGLTCSIGITPNKLLSKLASELQKPDGLTLLRMEDIPSRIWPLPVAALNGVGPKAAERLRGMGLDTLRALAAADPVELIGQFGKSYGAWLVEAAHGRDERPIVTSREPKSISRETTFERDLHPKLDREALSTILLDLCARLAGDLARKGVFARGVGIKLRFEDFKTVTRDTTLEHPVRDAESLRAAARACLKRVELGKRLRLLGVKASALTRDGEPPPAPPEPFERPLPFD